MQFLVIARDSQEPGAAEHRAQVRPAHLQAASKTVAAGQMLIGGAILEGRQMVGSMTVVSFETREEFDDWLRNVPYMKNGVWQDVQVFAFQVAAVGNAEALAKAVSGS